MKVLFITSTLKPLVILAIWWALVSAIYSRIVSSFALNRTFFPAIEKALQEKKPTTTTNQISRLAYSDQSNCWKMKDNYYNFLTNQLSTRSVKHQNRFENHAFERPDFAIFKMLVISETWRQLLQLFTNKLSIRSVKHQNRLRNPVFERPNFAILKWM